MKTIEEEAASATAAGEQPKATKKAARAPGRAHVAPKKGKAAREARPAKKAPRAAPRTPRVPRVRKRPATAARRRTSWTS